jgi:type IV secretory pathway protease TraF
VTGASSDDRVPSGGLVLFGDNNHSVDSRALGYFPGERVLGVVLRPLSARAGATVPGGVRGTAPDADS